MEGAERRLVDNIVISGHVNDSTSPVVRAILFSRVLLPTYYVCLTSLVFVAAGLRYANRQLQRSRTRHGAQNTKTLTSSLSSSSTLTDLGAQAKQDESHHERSFLIAPQTSPSDRYTTLKRLQAYIRSFILYQPRPIWALTASSNKLPSNGSTLAILVLLAINLFYLFYQNVPVLTPTFAFANRTGLCFVANLPVLYLLGAKNNKPLKWLTGWSYEGLNIVHRRLGEWMIILAVLHIVGMLIVWYDIFRPLGHSIWWFFSLKIIALGLAAFISYLLIYVTSTAYFREACYETFLATHIILQVAALVLVFLHHHAARWYCGAALAVWVADRLVTRVLVSWKTLVATLQVAPDGETVLLFLHIPLITGRYGGIKSGWKAGQHVFISIPGLGWSHRYQAHPFTISSPAPPSQSRGTTWPMQLIIKGKDGFSKELLEFAKYHQHTKVVVDGPYGSVEVLDAIQHADRTCLIAGGTGIAVTYPLSWEILGSGAHEGIFSSRTTYQSGRKLVPRFSTRPKLQDDDKHMHLWIRQKSTHGKWITMFPRLASRAATSLIDHASDQAVAVELVDRTFDTRERAMSRPDIDLEVTDWLRNASLPAQSGERICVVVSGPDELAREVRNTVSRLTREGYNIEVFVEKFGW